MKKTLIYFIFILLLVVIFKYAFSNYNMEYKISNYDIKMNYKNSRFYYEIKDDKYTYNFDYYKKRNLKKSKITNIIKIEEDNIRCIYPVIKNVDTYPLCYQDGVFTDYNLIDLELLEQYKITSIDVDKSSKDFVYHNNLSNKEYVALWNYKGYIVMNGNTYNNIELFNNDRYDNTLSYLLKDSIYMANYDEEHEYSSLVVLNVKDLNTDIIDLKNKIDFDSYIVGSIDNNLYIFDNKYSKLYEINIKKEKVTVIADNDKGFIKYENGEFVPCSKNEYKVNKIKFNNYNSNYTYSKNNGIYKVINDNKNISQKIVNSDVIITSEYKNNLYYVSEDSFYLYNPVNGSKKIFYNYELNFNTTNSIYVYVNN